MDQKVYQITMTRLRPELKRVVNSAFHDGSRFLIVKSGDSLAVLIGYKEAVDLKLIDTAKTTTWVSKNKKKKGKAKGKKA